MDLENVSCFRCRKPGHLKANCPENKPRLRFGRTRGPEEPATYLAEIEDSEGHPMAIRVPLGVTTMARPPCAHRHSLLCAHPDN